MQRNSKYAVPGNYFTALPPEQELMFRRWVQQNKVPFNPEDSVSDYDMRGFWSALQRGDPRATSNINPNDSKLHYPDVWKTPYHETFSSESQWAMPNAPTWKGTKLILRDGTVIFDEKEK